MSQGGLTLERDCGQTLTLERDRGLGDRGLTLERDRDASRSARLPEIHGSTESMHLVSFEK